MARFLWHIHVRQYNEYGDRIVKSTPVTVIGKDRDEVTDKVHEMFNAKYDTFREFWSHSWYLDSVTEIDDQEKMLPVDTTHAGENNQIVSRS